MASLPTYLAAPRRHALARTLALLLALVAAAAGAQAAGPALHVAETTHDFGMIREADGPVACDFLLRNDGDTPLVVVSAKTQCGCTTPEIPKEPLRPGQTATLRVTYDPTGRPGEFEKTIRVRTNQRRVSVVLRITGTVLPSSTPDQQP